MPGKRIAVCAAVATVAVTVPTLVAAAITAPGHSVVENHHSRDHARIAANSVVDVAWPGELSAQAANYANARTLVQGAVEGLAAIQATQAAQAAQAAAAAAAARAQSAAPQQAAPPAAGVYSFAALEQLWVAAGGPSWAAASAASIAECESGGRPNAYNPSGASGLWQILGQVVPGWIFDPMVNAENAVAKFTASGDTFAQWVC
jgi:hypothetical protein